MPTDYMARKVFRRRLKVTAEQGGTASTFGALESHSLGLCRRPPPRVF